MYGPYDESLFDAAFFEGIMDFEIDTPYIEDMESAIFSHQNEILTRIAHYAPKFDVETMLKTNLLAMMIAVTEMLYSNEEIPAKVSINEAVELSKYFWDESDKRIVNGILNTIYTDITQNKYPSWTPEKKFNFFPSEALQNQEK